MYGENIFDMLIINGPVAVHDTSVLSPRKTRDSLHINLVYMVPIDLYCDMHDISYDFKCASHTKFASHLRNLN